MQQYHLGNMIQQKFRFVSY